VVVGVKAAVGVVATPITASGVEDVEDVEVEVGTDVVEELRILYSQSG